MALEVQASSPFSPSILVQDAAQQKGLSAANVEMHASNSSTLHPEDKVEDRSTDPSVAGETEDAQMDMPNTEDSLDRIDAARAGDILQAAQRLRQEAAPAELSVHSWKLVYSLRASDPRRKHGDLTITDPRDGKHIYSIKSLKRKLGTDDADTMMVAVPSEGPPSSRVRRSHLRDSHESDSPSRPSVGSSSFPLSHLPSLPRPEGAGGDGDLEHDGREEEEDEDEDEEALLDPVSSATAAAASAAAGAVGTGAAGVTDESISGIALRTADGAGGTFTTTSSAAAAHLQLLPPNWSAVRHSCPGGAHYFKYHGPNGEVTKSRADAWIKAAASERGQRDLPPRVLPDGGGRQSPSSAESSADTNDADGEAAGIAAASAGEEELVTGQRVLAYGASPTGEWAQFQAIVRGASKRAPNRFTVRYVATKHGDTLPLALPQPVSFEPRRLARRMHAIPRSFPCPPRSRTRGSPAHRFGAGSRKRHPPLTSPEPSP